MVQYFLLYDNENQPTVLMNFKGMEWEEQDAKNFIDTFKTFGFFNNVDLENETIHWEEKQNIELEVNKILKNGLNEIKFHIKNPIRPVSRLESVDGRLLGLKIINISFI